MPRFFLGCFLIVASVAYAGNSDLEIHCMPKQTDASASQLAQHGTVNKSAEHWKYEVTVENKTFRDLSGLDVKYVIFFKQEKLGEKIAAAQQQRRSGSVALDSLRAHEKKSVTTEAVELKKSNLGGDWYYPGNERQKAQDSLAGVWVRVYQGGQIISEYANPSILMREKWE